MILDLSHRRILVTGAAQGLGLGIARHLASCGAALVLTDVNPRVCEHLGEPLFANAIAVTQDLAHPQAASRIMETAGARFGSINGLINCAAWSLQKPIADISVDEFDLLIAINQRAPYFLSQQFATQLTDADADPCIVNIASVNALVGNPRLVAYAGTKGALVAMTRALAVELAPRVRVLAISPGAIRTDYTEELIRAGVIDPAALCRQRLIPRFTEPGEIAAPVAFLLGPAAECITGSNWTCDGGYTAR
jgi:NAD(P)-dependent dehydrogenase (short-subunit alcohol dehydrogenase family)